MTPCDICHTVHGPHQAHSFPKTVDDVRNQIVTKPVTTPVTKDVVTVTICNQCVTKDAEIARLRNQNELLREQIELRDRETMKPPKRDRAAYMKVYRAKGRA